MILIVASLLILWFAVSRSNYRLPVDPKTMNRLIKLGAAVFALLAAAVVFLRGHFEIALMLLGGALWLFNLANKKVVVLKKAPSPAARATLSRVRSAMIEMELDLGTGAMQGLILAGPDEGRRLEQMSRAQCEAVYAQCQTTDPEGARLLEAYFDRRFAGWRQTRQGDSDTRRDRARRSNSMSEDEAYEVLGLARGAARDDVVRSHRSLMKKLHPDQGGSTNLAARVNEAKEVLMRRHT
jgi:hypothetical protein